MSQADMAGELGLTRMTVSRYELDLRAAPRAVLMSWGLVTGVPYSWLETGEVPPADDAPGKWPARGPVGGLRAG